MLIVPHVEHWKHRAVKATGGNTTKLGCYLLAVLGWQHGRHPPRFGSRAAINAEGYIISHVQDKAGTRHANQVMDRVQDVVDGFRGLADHLKLSDRERAEMFAELRKWFSHDARANQSTEERGINKLQ